MRLPAPLLLLAVALPACPPAIDTGDDGKGPIIITPKATIIIRDTIGIEVPQGAVKKDVEVTLTLMESGIPEVPGRKRVSPGYRLSPVGVTFDAPVKLYLPYDEQQVPEGVPDTSLDMRRQSGADAYAVVPGGAPTVVEGKKLYQASTDRLGLFWVTSPTEPSVTRVELTPPDGALRVGDTLQFSAKVIDPTGATLDVPVRYDAVPARAAQISEGGLLTAIGPGYVEVRATGAGVSATATVRVAGNTVGPRSFIHDNPLPTGNDLYGGTSDGTSALFVGAAGTVLARTGAGTFERVFSAPGVTLKGAAGSLTQGAVAVGTLGTTGVVVEVKSGTANPLVTTFADLDPGAVTFDGTHGMAVGAGNDVIVRREGKWVREYSPSFERLLAVTGDGAGGFTTLGSRGSIYRFDPVSKTWNSLFQAQLSVLLTAGLLSGASGEEAYAVGGNKLWRFRGGAWTSENLPDAPALEELTAVARFGARTLVAGRAKRQGHVLVLHPGPPPSWTAFKLRGPQVIRGFVASGAESASGFAVGDFGAVWQYEGDALIERSSGFYGNVADVSALGDLVVVAVNECDADPCEERRGHVLARVSPGRWEPLGTPQPFSRPLYSVLARGPSEVLATGAEGVFRYDGAAWSPLPFNGTLLQLRQCGGQTIGAGAFGTIGLAAGAAAPLTPTSGPTLNDLHAVHCTGEDNVWSVGDFTLLERPTGGVFINRQSESVNLAPFRAVFTPGPGEAFAFGDARYGVYWNSRSLVVIDTPGGLLPEVMTGVFGSSVDNLYAVGFTVTPAVIGYAVRFNGATWSLVDLGAHRPATRIGGTSATDLWVTTEGGGVLRALPP